VSESSAPRELRNPGLLGIYCNDHLASATGGIELVRRMIGTHRNGPYESRLHTLLSQLIEERTALRSMMAALSLEVRTYKQLATWAAEKIGRLKLNGHLLTRSPLSSVVEFEFVSTAVLGKRAGFETLRELADVDSRLDAAELDRLIAQANRQHEWLTQARREIAAGVWGGRAESASEAARR
jgi:hypothetical protein